MMVRTLHGSDHVKVQMVHDTLFSSITYAVPIFNTLKAAKKRVFFAASGNLSGLARHLLMSGCIHWSATRLFPFSFQLSALSYYPFSFELLSFQLSAIPHLRQ